MEDGDDNPLIIKFRENLKGKEVPPHAMQVIEDELVSAGNEV